MLDEGRFGRISDPKRCWSPHGIRPDVPHSLEAVEDTLMEALANLEKDKKEVVGLTGFDWIVSICINAT